MTENPANSSHPQKVPPDRAKRAMKETLRLVKKMGAGAVGLLANLKKDRSPEAMLATLDGSLTENRARRANTSKRIEDLHNQIVQGKGALTGASTARKRIIESELKSQLAEYRGAERELQVLLENERVIAQVKGRINEIGAYDISAVSESMIDDVIDDVDERAADADAVASASRDLEKAGHRRESETDEQDFAAALAEFDEEPAPSSLAEELASFTEEPIGDQPDKAKEKEEEA